MARQTVTTTIVIYQPIAHSLLVTNEAKAFVEGVAQECAEAAKDINPERTGRSSSQIAAYPAEVRDGVACASFGSSSPIWHILEFGSVHNQPFRALTQAAQRVCEKYEAM